MPAAKKGEVDSMLSILSKSPPCPGKIEPLFFNPTFLLKTLIVRSPTIDNTVIAKQNGIKINKSISPKYPYNDVDTNTAKNSPNTPSHVFPGLIFGKSFNLPNNFPEKKAPISAIQINSKNIINFWTSNWYK